MVCWRVKIQCNLFISAKLHRFQRIVVRQQSRFNFRSEGIHFGILFLVKNMSRRKYVPSKTCPVQNMSHRKYVRRKYFRRKKSRCPPTVCASTKIIHFSRIEVLVFLIPVSFRRRIRLKEQTALPRTDPDHGKTGLNRCSIQTHIESETICSHFFYSP